MHRASAALEFIQAQKTLMNQQAAAIESGNYDAAISAGVKLNAAKKQWANLAAMLKSSEWDARTTEQIRASLDEMIALHNRLLEKLQPERKRLNSAIEGVRRGRQLVNSYRSRPRRSQRFFEIEG